DDAKPRHLGGSLPVPNVQDLAARRDELTLTPTLLDRVPTPLPAKEQEQIPVVDLGRLLDLAGGREEEAARLRWACENWGFFQVVNHGTPEETVEEMKRNVMGFFALPLAEKAALAQEPGEIEGYGQAFVVSEEQTLDWADMFFLLTQPPSYRATSASGRPTLPRPRIAWRTTLRRCKGWQASCCEPWRRTWARGTTRT
uniref:Non-haem dioxygenase N-terminal domain-containing protein n=1 Tax=Aegilops tauschii subsp. strangulata TaxID=200361 RepID=A0A453DPS2_AEGTS